MSPVMLHVYTSHLSVKDPDKLDVTRQTSGPEGSPFAPSWSIVRPVLAARRGGTPWRTTAEAEAAWERYVPLYVEEMRSSYRTKRAAWERLLGRQRVVLACYCADAKRCHRSILASIFGMLGARVAGEIQQPARDD